MIIPSRQVLAFPRAAPLSTSMVLHALGEDEQNVLHAFASAGGRTHRHLVEKLESLYGQVAEARIRVFHLISSYVAEHENPDGIAVAWFQEALSSIFASKNLRLISPQQERDETNVSRKRVAEYRSVGFLLPRRPYQPLDINRTSSVLVAASVETRTRGLAAKGYDPYEPLWYCYLQRSLHDPVEVVPYPLPTNLPEGALIWSQWAPHDPYWRSVGNAGGIRFTDASLTRNGQVKWTIKRKLLEQWSDAPSDDLHLLNGFGSHASQDDAEAELHRLALHRLSFASDPWQQWSTPQQSVEGVQ